MSEVSKLIDLANRLADTVEESAKYRRLADTYDRYGNQLELDVTAWAEANLTGDQLTAFLEMVRER